jgi:hypothetical protein
MHSPNGSDLKFYFSGGVEVGLQVFAIKRITVRKGIISELLSIITPPRQDSFIQQG